MNKTFTGGLTTDLFKVCARFTQADASEYRLTNFEFFADQVVESYTAG
jgi:hypothetical protein